MSNYDFEIEKANDDFEKGIITHEEYCIRLNEIEYEYDNPVSSQPEK